jgi:hypothetical protein
VTSPRVWLVSSIGFAIGALVFFAWAFGMGISPGANRWLADLLAVAMVVCGVLWVVTLLVGTVLLVRQPRKHALDIAIVVIFGALSVYFFGPGLIAILT